MFNLIRKRPFGHKKYFFIIPRTMIKLIGFWPGSEIFRGWQEALAVVNALEMLVFGVFQANFCLKNKDNLVMFLNGFTPLFSQIVTASKILILVWKRHDVKKILNHLSYSFLNGMKVTIVKRIKFEIFYFTDNHQDSIKVNQRMCKLSFFITLVPATFGALTGLFFMILPVILEIYLFSNGLERMYELPLKAE